MHDAAEATATSDTHITSIVVHVRPEAVTEVVATINGMLEAEVHVASSEGKLVVSLETGTLHQVTERVDDINRLPGVVNALLVYHQVEDTARLNDEIDMDAPIGERTPKVTS